MGKPRVLPHFEELCDVAAWWWLSVENLRAATSILARLEEEAEQVCRMRKGKARDAALLDLEQAAFISCRDRELLGEDIQKLRRKAAKLLGTKDSLEISTRLTALLPACAERGLLREFVPREAYQPRQEKKRVARRKVAGLHVGAWD